MPQVTKNILLGLFGTLTPLAFGLLMRKSFLMGNKAKSGLFKGLQNLGRHFDYSYIKKWPLLSLGAIATIAIVNDLAEFMAARIKRVVNFSSCADGGFFRR